MGSSSIDGSDGAVGDILRVDQGLPDGKALERAAEVLGGGGVVVIPTDSVYGIGCAATEGNPAHRRIFEIKRRDRAQTLPWLVADVDDLDRFGVNVPSWAHEMARRWWPGALTLVVRASAEVPPEYRRAADGTIALRLPGSELVRQLARRVGVPLATTSANTHGKDAATSGGSIEPRIIREADLTLDAGPAPIAVASTIVGCTGDAPTVFRVGPISEEEVADVARDA